MARHAISCFGLDVVVDPCAAVLVLVVTGLLCFGIKEVLIDSIFIFFPFFCFYVFIF